MLEPAKSCPNCAKKLHASTALKNTFHCDGCGLLLVEGKTLRPGKRVTPAAPAALPASAARSGDPRQETWPPR